MLLDSRRHRCTLHVFEWVSLLLTEFSVDVELGSIGQLILHSANILYLTLFRDCDLTSPHKVFL